MKKYAVFFLFFTFIFTLTISVVLWMKGKEHVTNEVLPCKTYHDFARGRGVRELIEQIRTPKEAAELANAICYQYDHETYGEEEFWAPFETMHQKGGIGDCEDRAIAIAASLADNSEKPRILSMWKYDERCDIPPSEVGTPVDGIVLKGSGDSAAKSLSIEFTPSPPTDAHYWCDDTPHAVALYEKDFKYGSIGAGDDFTEAKYESVEDLVRTLGYSKFEVWDYSENVQDLISGGEGGRLIKKGSVKEKKKSKG